jgi:WD40 repeat protein
VKCFQKVTSFALSQNEDFLVCGSLGGVVFLLATEDLSVISQLRTSVGSIEVVATHPSLPLAAAMAMDHSISLIDIKNPKAPSSIDRFSTRDELADNEYFENIVPNQSLSQALCFHPTDTILASRTGHGALLELELRERRLQRIRATRLHDTDLITARYVRGGEAILSGAGGDIVLSSRGIQLARWIIGERNHHWFEPISDHRYLVACDELHALIINIERPQDVVVGPAFMRDDFEHVTYNRTAHTAYAAGFDGDLYQINPESLAPLGIVWRAPYKLRWIKTLESAPHIIFAHSFNGGLYRYNLQTNEVEAEFKHTPATIWTCVRNADTLTFAGEGPYMVNVEIQSPDIPNGIPRLSIQSAVLKQSDSSFTKRLIKYPGTPGTFLLAQKNGKLLDVVNNTCELILDLKDDIRDIAYCPRTDVIYACAESGRVSSIHRSQRKLLAVYQVPDQEPQWSLSMHHSKALLSVAGRRGSLSILSAHNLEPIRLISHQCARPKRMKWLGDDLLFVQTDELKRYSYTEDKIYDYVDHCDNTIEDFIWDITYNCLVLVCYKTEVILCDLSSGQKRCIMPDQSDFCKGLEWINPYNNTSSYPLDFITFGRQGSLQKYRIHNDRLFSLGSSVTSVLEQSQPF